MSNQMKRIGAFSAIYLLVLYSAFGQCSSSQDCFNKGQSTNFSSQKVNYFTEGIKYAKKEGINPAKFFLFRGVAHYNSVVVYSKSAVKDFQAAIKADENYYLPYMWMALTHMYRSKDYKEALKWVNEGVEKFPENPQAYYERARVHNHFNQTNLAFADYENAYNLLVLMMDAAENIDTQTKGNICRWYALSYMQKNNLYVYDKKTLEILETGATLAPNSPVLLGDLALAYYDNDQIVKANEIGMKAVSLDAKTYNSKNVGGNFIKGLEDYNRKSLYDAASYCGYAEYNLKHPHPLVYFYYSIAAWEYYLSIFDSSPNGWRNNVNKIKNRLELTIKYGTGTKYQYLADAAKKNLEALNQ